MNARPLAFTLAVASVAIACSATNSPANNFGVIFPCGPTSCDSGSQYCEKTLLGGQCQGYPGQCNAASPSCACVLSAVGPKCCTYAPDGSITIDDTKTCP